MLVHCMNILFVMRYVQITQMTFQAALRALEADGPASRWDVNAATDRLSREEQ